MVEAFLIGMTILGHFLIIMGILFAIAPVGFLIYYTYVLWRISDNKTAMEFMGNAIRSDWDVFPKIWFMCGCVIIFGWGMCQPLNNYREETQYLKAHPGYEHCGPVIMSPEQKKEWERLHAEQRKTTESIWQLEEEARKNR